MTPLPPSARAVEAIPFPSATPDAEVDILIAITLPGPYRLVVREWLSAEDAASAGAHPFMCPLSGTLLSWALVTPTGGSYELKLDEGSGYSGRLLSL